MDHDWEFLQGDGYDSEYKCRLCGAIKVELFMAAGPEPPKCSIFNLELPSER